MRFFYFVYLIIIISLYACSQKYYQEEIPDNIEKFTNDFIAKIHKGNITNCIDQLHSEMNNDNTINFLNNIYSEIKLFALDSFRVVSTNKHVVKIFKDSQVVEFTDYTLHYEYKIKKNKFLHFEFKTREENNNLFITTFYVRTFKKPLLKIHEFTLKDKSFIHYVFLFFIILVPIFIVVSLIFVIKTPLKRKKIWFFGVLLGFMKFQINWTTGEIGFSLIQVSLLGAGAGSLGEFYPSISYFSLPIVAIVFWYRNYSNIFK